MPSMVCGYFAKRQAFHNKNLKIVISVQIYQFFTFLYTPSSLNDLKYDLKFIHLFILAKKTLGGSLIPGPSVEIAFFGLFFC